MLSLREIVELTEIEIGQVTIPVSVFGFSYAKLEKIFIASVKFFEQWYPYEDDILISSSQLGTPIPEAQGVIWVRHNFGNFVESMPKLPKNLYRFSEEKKTFYSEFAGTLRVHIAGHYPVGYFAVEDESIISLYENEDFLEFILKGHFKRGTLKLTLDEGIIFDSIFSVNILTNQIEIDPFTGEKLYTGAIVNLSSTDTLPVPLLALTDYYLIKDTDTLFRLALSRQDALDDIEIDISTLGMGVHNLTKIPFTLQEDTNTYKEFVSGFSTNITSDSITLDNPLFYRALKEIDKSGQVPVVLFRNIGGLLPDPLIVDTFYYVILIDDNIIKLATSLTDAYEGTVIDLTDVGTGTHTIVLKNNSEDDSKIIHLSGTLGNAEINIDTLAATFFNDYGLKGDLIASYVSKYRSVEGLSIDSQYNDFLFTVFKQKFAEGLARSKAVIKTQDFEIDITADDLITAQSDLAQQVTALTESRGKWWCFS